MNGNRKSILHLLVLLLVFGSAGAQNSGKFKVVLDPGHGAKDYGAIYHGFIEKKIALSVALKVGDLLEKYKDIQTIYTRKTDVFIELNERANIANNSKADIFVSIHCNGAVNQSAYGTETFVMGTTRNASNLEVQKRENDVVTMEKDYKKKYNGYDPKSPESVIGMTLSQEKYNRKSMDLASLIQENFTDGVKRKSRGVKPAGFLVLRDIYMPRVLVELGFLSHQPEGEFLNSEEGQDKLADAIADAIIRYKKENFTLGAAADDEPSETKEDDRSVTNNEPARTKPETPKTVTDAERSNDEYVFKVQIAASGKDLETIPENFKGLKNITKSAEGSIIKYFYGNTGSYESAKQLVNEAKEVGYTSAFIVAFKDGKKSTVKEALSAGKR